MSAEGARETSAEKAPYGCDHLHHFVFGRQLSASRSGVTCRRSAPVLGGGSRFTGAGSSLGFIFRDFLLPSRFFFNLVHSSFFPQVSCFVRVFFSASFLLVFGFRFAFLWSAYSRVFASSFLHFRIISCFVLSFHVLFRFFFILASFFRHSCLLRASLLFLIASFFCFIHFPFFLTSFWLSVSFLYSCFLQYSHILHIYHLLASFVNVHPLILFKRQVK